MSLPRGEVGAATRLMWCCIHCSRAARSLNIVATGVPWVWIAC